MGIKEYYKLLEKLESDYSYNTKMLAVSLASFPINLYRKRLELLTYVLEKEKVELMLRFANSHNTYKVGDTVSDDKNTIVIRYIGYYKPTDSNIPLLCKYGGNNEDKEFKVILTENVKDGNYIKENQNN